ncbi:hypothetical protein Hanom_Chr10g00915631 [Helianthus anomalus]
MRGVTTYHLLNPLEESHRVRGENAKSIESERDEHMLILNCSYPLGFNTTSYVAAYRPLPRSFL